MRAVLKPCRIPPSLRRHPQFIMGRRIEREHTTSQRAADCITVHHLAEEAKERGVQINSPKLRYYTGLVRMERSWKRRK